jgi:hypothetical protein
MSLEIRVKSVSEFIMVIASVFASGIAIGFLVGFVSFTLIYAFLA